MFLAVDIGNSNTVCGIFFQDKLRHTFRFRTEINITSDELALMLKNFLELFSIKLEDIHTIAIASVVPPLIKIWQNIKPKYFLGKICCIQAQNLGLPILLDQPQEVGVDRVLNALAAWEKFHTSLVIVDYGTATTFDCVSEKGEYLGGAIAPGISLAAEALFQKTSMLPRVDLFCSPQRAIGKNTFEALRSGLLWGFASLTEGLIKKLRQEFSKRPQVIATGGLAPLMKKICPSLERIEPFLTLEGLYFFYKERMK